MPSQPRHDDGRFAEGVREEADVVLQRVSAPAADDAYNADGTFEFPPPARTYGQLVSFWLSCPVSDTVIRQMQIAYVEHMSAQAESDLAQWVEANPPPARYTKGRFSRPDEPNPEYDQWAEAYNVEQDRLDEIHPLSIDPTVARDLARVARMRWQAVNSEAWLPGITSAVNDTELSIVGRGDVAIGDLLERYPVDELDESVWRDQTAERVGFIAEQLDALARIEQDRITSGRP